MKARIVGVEHAHIINSRRSQDGKLEDLSYTNWWIRLATGRIRPCTALRASLVHRALVHRSRQRKTPPPTPLCGCEAAWQDFVNELDEILGHYGSSP